MSVLLFYKKPAALNPEAHRHFTLKPSEGDFSFAAKTNSVAVAGVEFFDAGKEYPIAFARVGDKEIVPVALLGLRADENLFIDGTGKWDGRYIPAFVRRYPFALAETGTDQLTVCIDESCPGFNAEGGQSLFDEAGQPGALLKQAMDFLREYHQHLRLTEGFVKRLESLNLFKEMSAVAELKDGTRAVLNGLLVVDEAKLAGLTNEQVVELFRSGGLALIYAHLASLGNLGRLMDRLAERKAQPLH